MKNLSFLFLVVFVLGISFTSSAQENDDGFQTLFKQNGKTSVSGFGGLIMEFSNVDEQFAFSMGAQGAALFNQSFFIGLYGQGVVNMPNYTYPQPPLEIELDQSILFFHGGFYTGFVFYPNKPIHFGLSSKFGWGGISLYDNYYDNNYYYPPRGYYPYQEYHVDMVFVVTPQIEAEFNITNWFKFNMGLGYRFVSGVDGTYDSFDSSTGITTEVPYFDSNDFDNMTFSLGFYFGWFK